ncbi:MAG: helix-hairpin-helix domain-containing protein [Proteobacteria bacterium]|nr:helix-hairpin-helix domain-containing protein [Pseudomonadota bacterium]MBU1717246.1 helix-hairpin-helix domain-containing protein [Pseudomonadota bacterium]
MKNEKLCLSANWWTADWPITLTTFFLVFILFSGQALALSGKLNINTANRRELCQLPFIGESKAKAIIDYRKTVGPFTNIEQLLETKSIGTTTLEAIKPYLSINGTSTLITDKPLLSDPKESFTAEKLIKTSPGEIITLADAEYYHTLTSFIRAATDRIDLNMFLFKKTDSANNRPAKIMSELIKARQRGVEIRVVLEKSDYDEKLTRENEMVATELEKNRIKTYFDSPQTTNHAKIVVIDQRFSFVGSHNLTHSALQRNHEFSLLVDSVPLAEKLTAYISSIIGG